VHTPDASWTDDAVSFRENLEDWKLQNRAYAHMQREASDQMSRSYGYGGGYGGLRGGYGGLGYGAGALGYGMGGLGAAPMAAAAIGYVQHRYGSSRVSRRARAQTLAAQAALSPYAASAALGNPLLASAALHNPLVNPLAGAALHNPLLGVGAGLNPMLGGSLGMGNPLMGGMMNPMMSRYGMAW
jgi:hypothetical protein